LAVFAGTRSRGRTGATAAGAAAGIRAAIETSGGVFGKAARAAAFAHQIVLLRTHEHRRSCGAIRTECRGHLQNAATRSPGATTLRGKFRAIGGDVMLRVLSPEFDDAVASVCHGTATDAGMRALNELLRSD